MFVAAGRAGIMRSIASPSTAGRAAAHTRAGAARSALAMSCWAGSSRGGPRSSTPPRCAGSCRR